MVSSKAILDIKGKTTKRRSGLINLGVLKLVFAYSVVQICKIQEMCPDYCLYRQQCRILIKNKHLASSLKCIACELLFLYLYSNSILHCYTFCQPPVELIRILDYQMYVSQKSPQTSGHILNCGMDQDSNCSAQYSVDIYKKVQSWLSVFSVGFYILFQDLNNNRDLVIKKLPMTVQTDALTELITKCTHTQIHHLHSVITPYFQKDFINLLPKEVRK